MAAVNAEKITVEQLIKRISGEYEALSKQLKVIARYVERMLTAPAAAQ